MDTAASPVKRRNPALIVVSVIGISLATIAGFAAYFLWPRGDRLGEMDLRAASPTLAVDLAAGDELTFRLDVTVGTADGYPNSSRSRSNAVHDELEASTLTVTLSPGDGPGDSTTCGAFDGKATTGSSSSSEVESSGLPLRCTLVAEKRGRHTLAARVEWVPEEVREAVLEVRRVRAGD
ncbi:hypothetical protein [Rhodococcus daqingensis]|uniref:Uncharacterized protein n=1 Tax=Rhodococcus daqingensis TaxID=2479363 RepID=A0ABW2RV25_9NOCA